MENHNGWGKAAEGMYYELKKHDFDIELSSRYRTLFKDYDADVEISFQYPDRHKFFCKDSYKISLTPWESSELRPNLAEGFAEVDEVWATSNWVYDVYKKNNVNENIYIYRHGLNNKYKIKKNIYDKKKPFTFLHIGEPDKRKGGRLVVETFAELFGNNPNYRLIIKAYKQLDMFISDPDFFGITAKPNSLYNNIIVIEDTVSLEELLLLFEASNVFVYPSAGEGFGYTPLEAICSGIPTICIPDWADYSDYITIPLKTKLSDSLEPDWHPGQTYLAEKEHLKELMLRARDEHEKWSEIAFSNASLAYEEFKWETTTKPIIERLKNIQISRNL